MALKDSVVGQHVTVVLASNAEYSGLIFAYERSLGLLVLQCTPVEERAPKGSNDFHILKIASVKNVINHSLKPPPQPLASQPQSSLAQAPKLSAWAKGGPTAAQIVAGKANSAPAVNSSAAKRPLVHPPACLIDVPLTPVTAAQIDKVKQRERNAIQREREAAKKLNSNVASHVQDIFNILDKTLPTRWKGDAIIVLDEVMIMPPYKVDDVRGITATSGPAVDRVQKILSTALKK